MATAQGPPMSVRALTGGDPGTVVFIISGRIDPEDITRLCGYVCEHIQRTDPMRVVCDLGNVVASDAVAVDALARLQLAARRRGCKVKLRNASRQLLSLLSLMGLDEIVPVAEA